VWGRLNEKDTDLAGVSKNFRGGCRRQGKSEQEPLYDRMWRLIKIGDIVGRDRVLRRYYDFIDETWIVNPSSYLEGYASRMNDLSRSFSCHSVDVQRFIYCFGSCLAQRLVLAAMLCRYGHSTEYKRWLNV